MNEIMLIGVPWKDGGCSLEKELIELNCMNS